MHWLVRDWLSGKKHGKGRLTWVDGSSYEGEYRDDMRKGFGTGKMIKGHKAIQRHENQVAFQGKWVGDVYVVQGLFDSSEKDGDFILSCSSPQNCKQVQAKRAREAADREATNRQACSRLYIGKPVSWPEGRTCVLTGCDNFTLHGQIVGVGNGVASTKVTESYKYGQVHEKACSEF